MCGKLPAASTVLERIKRRDKLSASFSSLAISAHSFHVSKIPDKSNTVVALQPAVAAEQQHHGLLPALPDGCMCYGEPYLQPPWKECHLEPELALLLPPPLRVSAEGRGPRPPEGSAGSCQLTLHRQWTVCHHSPNLTQVCFLFYHKAN